MSALDHEVRIHTGADEFAAAAAALVGADLRRAVARRGRASLVLAGGSTPLRAYSELARLDIPWGDVDVYWGDERCVPPEDPASNYFGARAALLEPAGIPEERVHRMPGELEPAVGAAVYEELLRERYSGPRPELDLVLLGVGADGHTASLFPGAAPTSGWVAPARAPAPPRDRLTLTYEAFGGARRTVFLVAGGGKAAVLGRVLGADSEELPAARVAARAARVTWLADREAAAGLGEPGAT